MPGGISTLQSRASGLQSTTQGIPSGPKRLLNETCKQQNMCGLYRCTLGITRGFDFSTECVSRMVSKWKASQDNFSTRQNCGPPGNAFSLVVRTFTVWPVADARRGRVGLAGHGCAAAVAYIARTSVLTHLSPTLAKTAEYLRFIYPADRGVNGFPIKEAKAV